MNTGYTSASKEFPPASTWTADIQHVNLRSLEDKKCRVFLKITAAVIPSGRHVERSRWFLHFLFEPLSVLISHGNCRPASSR